MRDLKVTLSLNLVTCYTKVTKLSDQVDLIIFFNYYYYSHIELLLRIYPAKRNALISKYLYKC